MTLLKNDSPSKKRCRSSSVASSPLLAHDLERPVKRKGTEDEFASHRPRGFGDNLSKVHLTRGALREFDRKILGRPYQLSCIRVYTAAPSTEQRPNELKRFARQGGPDLSRLRGVSIYHVTSRRSPPMMRQFTRLHDRDGEMSQPSPGYQRSPVDDNSPTRRSKSSYDANFKQSMIDNGIHSHNRGARANNVEEIRDHLQARRLSLSPSRFDDADFEKFVDLNERVIGESRAMGEILTIIEGQGRYKYHSDGPDHLFNHLEPLSKDFPKPKPDIYDGAIPQRVDLRVRQDLGPYIVPCTDTSQPVAPNFFIEGKSAGGRADVAKLQACHDGAMGARAIHSLENYREHKPQYDGNIKSYSCTYHAGTSSLKLYGHYITAPSAPEGRPEYYMTQLDGYDMTSNQENFLKGATAFRNLRDLAESTRNSAIEAANCAARHAPDHSPSTLFESHASSSYQHQDHSDTSTDELASKEMASKLSRCSPLPNSRHNNSSAVCDRPSGQEDKPATRLASKSKPCLQHAVESSTPPAEEV